MSLPRRNFLKSMVELNLPPWRFRHAGTPGFHGTWMRPAVFVTGLATNRVSNFRRECRSRIKNVVPQ